VAKTATKTSKRSATKNTKKAAAKSAGESEVTIDRRRAERREECAEREEAAAAPKLERRQKVNRRRQIDPTTCERDYTELEVEFMNALDDYKRKSGRMFPTCSEVLEVIRSLGYVKLSPEQMTIVDASNSQAVSAKPMSSDLQFEKNLEAMIAATEQLL
jgi:hypothetical protein